jgi:hypothetical protein
MNEKERLNRIKKSNEKWLSRSELITTPNQLGWIKEFKKRHGGKIPPGREFT